MKKIMLAAALFAVMTVPCGAEIIGDVYSSDILATVNGVGVESVNIGGRTAIIIEDFAKYGAKVVYNDEARVLSADFTKLVMTDTGVKRGSVGKIVDKIWQSDITATINDIYIPTFSLDGRLAVALEDLAAEGLYVGAEVRWDENTRTISAHFVQDNSDELPNIFAPHKTAYKIFADGHMEAYEYKFDDLSPWEEDTVLYRESSEPAEITFEGRKCGTVSNIGGRCGCSFDIDEIYSDRKYSPRTREEAIGWFEDKSDGELSFGLYMSRISERFDTDEYTFIRASQPTPHGTSVIMAQIFNDGSVIRYSDLARNVWGIATIKNFKINEEEQTVTFVNGPYARCIDLKTGEFTSTPLE